MKQHIYSLKMNLKKLQTFHSSLFVDQNCFNNDGAKLYLVLQPIYKTITTFSGFKDAISEWESRWLSNEKFTRAYIANISVCPKLIWMNNSKIRLTFKGSCLNQEDKAAYTPKIW